jgi:hypothetical protein
VLNVWLIGVSALALGGAASCSSATQIGGGLDASALDASTDGAPDVQAPVDASPDTVRGSDSSDDAASDGCVPSAVTSIPAFIPPKSPHTACTQAQIQAYWDACYASTSGTSNCNAFEGDPTNSPCVQCMLSDSTASAWGPVVAFPNYSWRANRAGCIALVDQDASPGSCAAADQAGVLCEYLACAPQCPTGATAAGFAAFLACEHQSDTTVCAQQVQGEQCAQAAKYGGCSFANSEAYFRGLGAIFCAPDSDGGGPSDAASGPG